MQFVPAGTATVVEIYVAILAACLPTMVPVYRQLRYGDPLSTKGARRAKSRLPNRSLLPSRGRGSATRKKQLGRQDSFERLAYTGNTFVSTDYHTNGLRTDISCGRRGGAGAAGGGEGESFPMEGIFVTQSTAWSTQNKTSSSLV